MERFRAGRRERPKPLILMYHRIAEADLDPWGLAVSPARFDEQLSALKSTRRILPLREFVARHRAGSLPPDATALTFDDGYACNALIAAPILARYRIPATFFLCTGYIGGPREFWWDELTRLFFETHAKGRLNTAIDDEEFSFDLGDGTESCRGGFDALASPTTDRERSYLVIWQALRDCSTKERIAVLDRLWQDLLGIPAPAARSSHRAMTPHEARNLARLDLMEIGAHTVNHPPLGAIASEMQRSEIADSKARCEALTGLSPVSFAYPHGDYTAETTALVQAAGFELACTTEEKAVGPSADIYALPRAQVQNWTAARLLQLVS